MGAMASQITSLAIVYSAVYSDPDQRKHQSSASLAFVRGFHRGPVNSPHKWPVTRKMYSFDDVIMRTSRRYNTQLLPHQFGNRSLRNTIRGIQSRSKQHQKRWCISFLCFCGSTLPITTTGAAGDRTFGMSPRAMRNSHVTGASRRRTDWRYVHIEGRRGVLNSWDRRSKILKSCWPVCMMTINRPKWKYRHFKSAWQWEFFLPNQYTK